MEHVDGFFSENKPTRTLNYEDNNFLNAVTFEVSTDHTVYKRKVYNILEFLSKLGGLFGAFAKVCIIFISIVNFFGAYQFLMAETFYNQ